MREKSPLELAWGYLVILGGLALVSSFLIVAHIYLVLYLRGESQILLQLNQFGERELEMALVAVAYLCVPAFIWETADIWTR